MKSMLSFSLFILLLAACTPAAPATQRPAPETDVTVSTARTPKAKPERPESNMPTETVATTVITYTRSGGLAGITESWTIYADGSLTSAAGETRQRSAEEVAALVQTLRELGIFSLESAYLPKDPCCDRFAHELTVRVGAKEITVTTLDATPGAPEELWKALRAVQDFIAEGG